MSEFIDLEDLASIKPPRVDKVRALIAKGMKGYRWSGIVLATDSVWLKSDIEAISDSVEDLGIDTSDIPLSGLYLWEGTVTTVCHATMDGYEPESEYTGTIRTVLESELPSILAMEPPDDEVYQEGKT